MYRILIVEDDQVIAGAISRALERWGYETRCTQQFDNVMEEFEQYQPHLALMDISLPFYNGYYWCAQIRRISTVPVIFLSSRTENMDIVMAVNMGGDDYITKPFSMEVLLAKVQAMLRRSYDMAGEAMPNMEFCGAAFSPREGQVCYQGKTVVLTKNEQRILQLLLQCKGSVVSREEMMRTLWDSECFVDDNTLSVNVNRLRKTLAEIGLEDCIETRKGLGYLLHD